MEVPSERESSIANEVAGIPRPRASTSLAAHGALKKAVDTLAVVPTNTRLSLIGRKIFNVLMVQAQLQGSDAPQYEARLRDIVTGMDFNSNNIEIIKEALRQLVSTNVEWQSPSRGEGAQWAVSGLIAHAELKKISGEVRIYWSYSPVVRQAVHEPARFARILLQVQAKLKSYPSLVLYEICARYADNPGGLTARQPWTWWRPVLTGSPEADNGAYVEWKYFNRDVVKHAVKEVNQNSDLSIEVVEHRIGRSIKDLQFKVKRKGKQQALGLSQIDSPLDLRNIGRAIHLGIPQSVAEAMYNRHGEERFLAALTALEVRLRRADLGEVRSRERFFIGILDNLDGNAERDEPPSLPPSPTAATVAIEKARALELLERYRIAKRELAQALYKEMPDSERRSLDERFQREVVDANATMKRAFSRTGVSSGMVKSLFAKFLADSLLGENWGSPSDAELLAFSLNRTV